MKIWLVYEVSDNYPYAIRPNTFKAFESYDKMYQYISARLDKLVPDPKEREDLYTIYSLWDVPDWETYKKVSIEQNDITELQWKEIEVK